MHNAFSTRIALPWYPEEIFLNRVLAYARKKEEEEETKRSNEECIIPQVPDDPPVQNKKEQQHIDEQQQSDSDADTTGAEDCNNGPVSSDRKTRFPVLVLDNSECLPKDTQIKRWFEQKYDETQKSK